ncbi:sulfur carrier protein ThiS [Marinilabiliaceae bacterium ANBcel2]|nr:sulfur carrier protein ThiS [Marinilabiliaceae bacterium ANBcel2]
MHLKVNGKEVFTNAKTLSGLILELEIPTKGVALAVDNEIVSNREWNTFELKQGADIVVISATRGG